MYLLERCEDERKNGMMIAPELTREYPSINDAQRGVVGHGEGPLLVIAGPGSGKTFALVLRAMNLLISGRAAPSEIVLCTFTEKAAYELSDRLSATAASVGYTGDLSELRVGTIHGICNSFLEEHRHHTPLGNAYETLDELTGLLFIFEHFEDIVGEGNEVSGKSMDGEGEDRVSYLGRWSSKWRAIKGLKNYFDKITEELVDPKSLSESSDSFLSELGGAYLRYEDALFAENRVDFAHLQKLLYDLMADEDVRQRIAGSLRYVLVDEYQDTNYVQEQLLLALASETDNLCVVGDEDQSLYRFRGATVRNILEFPDRFPGKPCEVVKLTRNYRSHEKIVTSYDKWMASADWSNPRAAERPFRYEKTIEPDPATEHPEYPAVFSIWGENPTDEAGRFADFVDYLKRQDVISDYNQVALLLHSVRSDHSGPYMEALEKKGISAFCPRARSYFDNEEIRLMVGCFAALFGYHGEGRGDVTGRSLEDLGAYTDECIVEVASRFAHPQVLGKTLRELTDEIENLGRGESLDLRPADYFYRLLAAEPFAALVADENRARNLAIFSQLLNAFQGYYHYTVVTYRNREALRFHFFNSFLRLLYEGGINEYEDPDNPFPKGYVQVMTIHQAKGLEFPVVVVGSLDKQLSSQKKIDSDLSPYYRRPQFEPAGRITHFDRMRLHYVAFSRPEKILVLTASSRPKGHFAPIWQGLPQWPYVEREVLGAQNFEIKDRVPAKRRFSFTGDIKVYETCARQYQFFREYDFTPSRSAVIFFGLLVHQTIEEIHRIVLDGQLHTLNEQSIRTLFDRTFHFLSLGDVRPIGGSARKNAFSQVMNYFRQNRQEMRRVVETEVDVSVEKEGYVLTGKVDLLMGADGKLELLDFKTTEKPINSPDLIAAYERQLATYAHILEVRHGKRPERLMLYWTSEPNKEEALMELPYRPEVVEEAGAYFDQVVGRIQNKEFAVVQPPEPKICKECDMKTFCRSEGLIKDPDAAYERQLAEMG